VSGTICLEAPAFGRGRVADGDRQMVPDTFFPLAGRISMEMTTKEVLPGSTGEGDRGIQAFTYRFPLPADPANRVPIEKPEGYDAADYRDLLADVEEGHVKRLRDVIQMGRAPNGKVVVNNDHMKNGHPRQSLDLAEENWCDRAGRIWLRLARRPQIRSGPPAGPRGLFWRRSSADAVALRRGRAPGSCSIPRAH